MVPCSASFSITYLIHCILLYLWTFFFIHGICLTIFHLTVWHYLVCMPIIGLLYLFPGLHNAYLVLSKSSINKAYVPQFLWELIVFLLFYLTSLFTLIVRNCCFFINYCNLQQNFTYIRCLVDSWLYFSYYTYEKHRECHPNYMSHNMSFRFIFIFGSRNAQKLLLAVLRGSYGMLRIEPQLATCKTSSLHAMQYHFTSFNIFLHNMGGIMMT